MKWGGIGARGDVHWRVQRLYGPVCHLISTDMSPSILPNVVLLISIHFLEKGNCINFLSSLCLLLSGMIAEWLRDIL